MIRPSNAVTDAEREEMRLVTTEGVRDAPLPEKYQAAKAALSVCQSVDECSTWAKKAAALASYARQADDDSLEKMSMKIRARAIRRCGELLQELPTKPGKRTDLEPGGGASPRSEAAKDAGLSRDQVKQAVRVASIPEKAFEAAVEAETPPSVEALAEQGTKKKPQPLVDIEGRDPKDFNRALQLAAAFDSFAKELREVSPEDFMRGALARHVALATAAVEVIEPWVKAFQKRSHK